MELTGEKIVWKDELEDLIEKIPYLMYFWILVTFIKYAMKSGCGFRGFRKEGEKKSKRRDICLFNSALILD